MNFSTGNFYFRVADSEYELKKCYNLRHKVYCEEKKWLSRENYTDEMEYDEFDEKAIHVCALDEDFQVMGYIRIMKQSDYSILPYQSHPSLKDDKSFFPNLAELSRFIIRSDKSGLFLAKNILKVVWQTSMAHGLENWTIVCEPSLIRLIKLFRYHFEPLAPPAMYYGGFTQPALLNAEKTLNRWRTSDLEALEFYHQAIIPDTSADKISGTVPGRLPL